MEQYKVVGGRQTYRVNDRYYQWDELHGEIEVYNKRGKHIAALHDVTGRKSRML
ncbi:MAG: hypothetical protein LBC28_04165 [Oscillospiraceae bacterium]|nr:hypothetical protein [Oscillospiraceae bacterium]